MEKEKDRKNEYAFLMGQSLSEGFPHDESAILKALKLNPESVVERSMRAKTDKERQKIGEKIIEAQNAFEEGYFEGAPKRKVLTQTENEEFARYDRLLRSNDPKLVDMAKTELEAFFARKLAEGVCPNVLEKVREGLK